MVTKVSVKCPFVLFQTRGNSSSSSNGFDMQSIRNTDGNDVCVDCGVPSKLVVLLFLSSNVSAVMDGTLGVQA